MCTSRPTPASPRQAKPDLSFILNASKPSNSKAFKHSPLSRAFMVYFNKENLCAHSICKHLEENNVIIRRQHGFIKNKSCQTNLISFFDFLTSWVGTQWVFLLQQGIWCSFRIFLKCLGKMQILVKWLANLGYLL